MGSGLDASHAMGQHFSGCRTLIIYIPVNGNGGTKEKQTKNTTANERKEHIIYDGYNTE